MDNEATGDQVVAFFDAAVSLLTYCNEEIDSFNEAIEERLRREEMTPYAADRKDQIHRLWLNVRNRSVEVTDFIRMVNASHRKPIHIGDDWAGGLISEAVCPVARLVVNVINVIGFPDEERTHAEAKRDRRVARDLLDRLPENWTAVSAEILEMERQRCLACLTEHRFAEGRQPGALWSVEVISKLKGQQRALLETMNNANGSVPIDEFAQKSQWVSPYDDAAASLIQRLNKNLEKHSVDSRIRRNDGRFEKIPKPT
ncbi:hypothetical protein Enr13x_27910 [Stieleria neptunia]|uniref:Uncharacterized protein n=1 Tax=Stieleria neptunia TaxID=2527979 RepID=A0A518HQ23_9BACT|nr:hypothetical protein [Stieleria neptunia]QDV42939.1 hypothetical protein Enr13x_27910 [Stieleria neptunia]